VPIIQKGKKVLRRKWLGVGLIIGWIVLFGSSLYQLIVFAFNSNVYTHILMIPVAFAYLIYVGRKRIFADRQKTWSYGAIALLAVGALGYAIRLILGEAAQGEDALFLTTLSAMFVFWGLFLGYFGRRTFIAALFPLSFLLLMVPLPSFVLDACVRFLQTTSVGTIAVLFDLFNVTFFREGSVFALPGLAIEVAPECSGIRSCFALIVLGLLASYLFLERYRHRAILMAAVFPVTIFKNALRIAFLAYLGAYVDKGFITDSMLHSEGGKPFLILAVLLLAPVLWALRRNEKKRSGSIKGPTKKGNAGIDAGNMGRGKKMTVFSSD
jgi:exosortase